MVPSMSDIGTISQNDFKSITGTNSVKQYPGKEKIKFEINQSKKNMTNNNSSRNTQEKPLDIQSDRSNGGQTQSFSGMQTFSFIGNKNKYGKKEGFGIQKWKDGRSC